MRRLLLTWVWFLHRIESRSLARKVSRFGFWLNNVDTRSEKHDTIFQSRLKEILIATLVI